MQELNPLDATGNHNWAYDEAASLPLPASIEDHLLVALRRLTATLDVHGVCEAVLSGVEDVFGATSSWIMLHDAARGVLRTALFRGRGAGVFESVEIPLDGAGVAGLTFKRGEIQYVADVAREDRWFNPSRVRGSGLRSALILPLIGGDGTIGVLGLDCPRFSQAHPPQPLDLKRLELFAAQAAIGLTHARLYQTSQQDRARLRALVLERRTLRKQVVELRGEVREAYSFGPIVGESPAMRHLLAELEQVAASDVTALLLGETGTGKELLARALHERSSRTARAFVPVNCAALPENLVESEMFGHERGAFTGAHARKPGRFEMADRGTLFLDEIGDLPLPAQAKLLRVIQDREVYRVGSTQPVKVDIRLVAATNQDLQARIAERAFRDDLFYRLSVFPLRVPPLRERREDIPLLARYLATQCARRMGRRVVEITEDAIDRLMSHAWPGNVRELQNVIERAVILGRGAPVSGDGIRLDGTPAVAAALSRPAEPQPPAEAAGAEDPPTLADAERHAIIQALRRAEGRVSGPSGAAAQLGLKPTTLHAKMKKLRVSRQDALRF